MFSADYGRETFCPARFPPFGSGSEAVMGRMPPSPSVGTRCIVAASRHGSLHTPTDGDGDEAEKAGEGVSSGDQRKFDAEAPAG
jgi:hypothetical protein